ncbi:MAG: hypothetical protein ABSA45_00175 [Verrucomicrobiota bacterium]|jgi:hypothetical protein
MVNAEFSLPRLEDILKPYQIPLSLSIANYRALGMAHLRKAIDGAVATFRGLAAWETPRNRATEMGAMRDGRGKTAEELNRNFSQALERSSMRE